MLGSCLHICKCFMVLEGKRERKRGSSNEVTTSAWHCSKAVQCLLHSLLQERKTLCVKDLKGFETPKVPSHSSQGHGPIWQAKEKFLVFSAKQKQNEQQSPPPDVLVWLQS